MGTTKIIYRISTWIFIVLYATTSVLYLSHSSNMVERLHKLGYPSYLLNLLGTAELLGVVVIAGPVPRYLKELAYAGFAFDLVGAAWSRLAALGTENALGTLMPITVFVLSYCTYQRLQSRGGIATHS
jgi:hypothetical protein